MQKIPQPREWVSNLVLCQMLKVFQILLFVWFKKCTESQCSLDLTVLIKVQYLFLHGGSFSPDPPYLTMHVPALFVYLFVCLSVCLGGVESECVKSSGDFLFRLIAMSDTVFIQPSFLFLKPRHGLRDSDWGDCVQSVVAATVTWSQPQLPTGLMGCPRQGPAMTARQIFWGAAALERDDFCTHSIYF